MNPSVIAVSVLLLLRSFSCQGKDNGPETVTGKNFPLSLGSTWTYAIYDSIGKTSDTVSVAVTDSAALSDDSPAVIIQYAYLHSRESQYVVTSGDSILVYRSPDVGSLSMIYVLPFAPGRQWISSPPGSMKVGATERVAVPAGAFERSFRIDHHPFIGNLYGGTTFWFVPNVGLVRMRRAWVDTMGGDRVNTVWELLKYDVTGSR
jgi:hypothetical protein